MTEPDLLNTEALLDDLRQARELIADMRSEARQGMSQQANTASHATNNNHFGGMGVVVALIIATVCCTAMLTGGAVYAFMASNQVAEQNAKLTALATTIDRKASETDQKLAGMQDYLNAIYVQAPSLKPKEKTE